MKKVVFLTTKDAEFGFELAGVTQYITDKTTIKELINKLLFEEISGLVVIDERLIDDEIALYLSKVENSWEGIFFVLPSPDFRGIEEDYARKIIRKTIGYQVKLNI